MANRWVDIGELQASTLEGKIEEMRQLVNTNVRRAIMGITAPASSSPQIIVRPPSPFDATIQIASAGASYTDSVTRDINDKLGETPSLLDFGAVGDGTTNDFTAIQNAIDATSATGRALRIPAGYVFLVGAALNLPVNTVLVGDGPDSTIKRGGTIAANKGLLDITGSNVRLVNFTIEGAVTASTGFTYADFGADPMSTLITANTSIWAHGVRNLVIDGVTISHSGGYAVLLDASSANVNDVSITNCRFVNNRPHLFGTSSGDKNYGSWTGGIFGRGDGASFGVDNIEISGCLFSRGTGNQIWMHLPAFGRLHTNWGVYDCTFEDIGRDCVLYGGLINGVVDGCTLRRVGYISTADSGSTTPKYLANNWAVGIDTSGLAINCAYTNNSLTSIYGGCFDLDGFSQGVLSGNVCRTPESGEVDYTEDAIASWTTVSYGINLGDTSNNAGGKGVLVVGNRFKNLGAGAIRLYAWQDGFCTGNLIDHPAAAPIAPLTTGPGGAGANQGSGNNVITGNTFIYSPAAAVACIQEDSSLASFAGAKNHVWGNTIMPVGSLAYEFYKNSTSGSITSFVLSTATTSLVRSESVLQREGTGAAGGLKFYSIDNATSQQVAQLSHDAFLNVSVNGGVATGVVATGAVSSLAWGNAMCSGKMVATGFMAIQHFGSGTFSSGEANALGADWMLFRFNQTTGDPEVSLTVSAGARVWTVLGAGSGGSVTVPGGNKDVIFNDSGLLGAESNFSYDKALKRLTLTGLTGTASIVAATSFIQSAEGFLTTSASSTAVNAASGGVTALSLISVRNDGAAGLTLSRSSGTARTYGQGVDASGQWFLSDQTAGAVRAFMETGGRFFFSNQLVVGGAVSGAGLLVQDGYVESTEGFYSPFSSYQTIQTPNGGMYARSFRAIAYTQVGQNFGVPSLTSGDGFAAGAIFWNTSASALQVFNGGSWVTIGGSSVSSVTAASSNIVVSPTTGAVSVNLSSSITISTMLLTALGNALTLSSGYVQAAGGFLTNSGNFNSIQTSGGILSQIGYYVGTSFSAQQVIDSSRNIYVATVKNTGGGDWINSFGQFVGPGVAVQGNGVGCGIVSIWNGSGYLPGQSATYVLSVFGGGATVLIFRGGVLTNA